MSQTRNYIINPDHIIQINYLNDIEKRIDKQDVIKFTAERIPYSILRFKRLTIYLSNGKKIRLQEFEFFNFKKIEPILIDYGYTLIK